MTEVSFHFNVPDRSGHVCRLVRKAVRSGAEVVLSGPLAVLEQADRDLWCFEETEFLPHRLLVAGETPSARLGPTRVWLVEDARQPGAHEVLINLGTEPIAGFESFDRLIEVVSSEPDDRIAARRRWKHYADRGYTIRQHDLGGAEAER